MRLVIPSFAVPIRCLKAATLCLLLFQRETGHAQAPPTFAQALTALGIGLTPTELDRALEDPDKRVRSLAAAELAELKAKDYLPHILHAANVEPDLLEKVNIAAAASWLGSIEGLNLLKTICGDPSLPADARQQAARNTFDRGDHACFKSIADMLLPANTVDVRIGASYLLSQLHDRTSEESDLVLNRLLPALDDKDLRLRLETCETLRWLNNPAALSSLRKALGTEDDTLVRSRITSTINALEKAKR